MQRMPSLYGKPRRHWKLSRRTMATPTKTIVSPERGAPIIRGSHPGEGIVVHDHGLEETSVTVGVPFDDARWWRGRETSDRAVSTCPDEACCRRPDPGLADRWNGRSWPSARVHTHMFSPLPRGAFPGVDDSEVYAFLDRHAAE